MITFKANGLKQCIKDIKAISTTVSDKNHLFLARLGKLGIDTARVRFKEADYDGNNDVTVSARWIDKETLEIIASGTSVLFIEFGSGMMGYGHPLASQNGYGPGTWSDGPEGKGKWKKPPWIYKGVEGSKNSNYGGHVKDRDADIFWSYGNPPARAMYETAKELREKIQEIAIEVYG